MRPFSYLFLFTFLLAGCASLTEEECTVGNWNAVGNNDAIQGHRPDRFLDHQKACRRYEILPDHSQYIEGYRLGLVTYCTPANGFNVGRNGYPYNGICPPDAESSFLSGYRRGDDLHNVETAMAQARNNLGKVQEQIGETRVSEASGKKRTSMFRLHGERRRLEEELKRLRSERDRLLLDADSFLQTAAPDI